MPKQKPSEVDRLTSRIKSFDWYGVQVPSFKLKGKDKVNTWPGACATYVFHVILLAYFITKVIYATSEHNPRVSALYQRDFYTERDQYNSTQENFQMAFTVENALDNESRLDENYVKLFARLTGTTANGEPFSREMHLRKCTKQDYNNFYPVSSNSAHLLHQIKTDYKRGMYCLNSEFILQGTPSTLSSSRLEILLLPCNHNLAKLGREDSSTDNAC